MLAVDLIAWTQTLLLSGELARAEPKTLRYRLLHVAARLTRSARDSAAHPSQLALGARAGRRVRPTHGPTHPAGLTPTQRTTRSNRRTAGRSPTHAHHPQRPKERSTHHPKIAFTQLH